MTEAQNMMSILVADDDAITGKMLTNLLAKWGYPVVYAADGLAAWKILNEPEAPALALLDWSMPGMEGIDICRQLRETFPDRPMYNILLTGRTNTDDVILGLQAGADDYLTKPFDKGELHARVNVGMRTIALQRSLALSVQTIEDTMERIQTSFLIGEPMPDIQGCRIAVSMMAYSKVAGDFYDFYRNGDTNFDLVIGDVIGKGVIAALLGAAISNRVLRAFRDQLVLTTVCSRLPSPAEITQRLDELIGVNLDMMESFVTLCYGRFDLRTQQLTLVDCGHTRPIHYRATDQHCVLLEGDNAPIGFPVRQDFSEISVPFLEGDTFLFYSDGMSEVHNADNEQFGEARLLEVVRQFGAGPPDELVHSLTQAIRAFIGERDFTDDATCIAVHVDACENQLPVDWPRSGA